MITANELRIGNWVSVSGKPTKIESINEQGINSSVSGGYYPGETEIEYEASFGGRSFWGSYSEPEAIPVTPELLIKCGFKKLEYPHKDYPPTIKYKFVGVAFVFVVNDGMDEFFIASSDDEFYEIHVTVNSLHQLQNLYFALTNEELKIEL